MSQADSRFDEAVSHHRHGRTDLAEASCRAILRTEPRHARALHLLGVIRFAAGDAEHGIPLLRDAIDTSPDYAEAHFNLAAMLAATGQPRAAAEHYGATARLRPDDLVARVRHCALLGEAGQTDKAVAGYRAILGRWPDCLPALLDLARFSLERGAVDEAIALNRRAATLEPDNALAVLRLGRALKEKGRLSEAIVCYRRAIVLRADFGEAHNYLAVALYEEGLLDEAERCARQAITLLPNDASPRFNLGIVTQSTGDIAAARRTIGEAIRLAPDNPRYRIGSLSSLLYDARATPAERKAAHQAFGVAVAAAAEPGLAPPIDADPNRRLRVGWVSSDFHDHPVARNLEMLFAHRSRAAFETIVYAEVASPDAMTEWFRKHIDLWRPTVGLTDGEVADRIREDRVDILIFLAGHLDKNRPQIAAWRPAPVQISFHDPATSGLPTMDYVIADRHLVPRTGAEWFAERVVRLPSFYAHSPIVSAPPIAPPPLHRTGFVTFGSFNHPAKINDEVVHLWAQVLASVPSSCLLLKHHLRFVQPNVQGRLAALFRAAGIDPHRIALEGAREPRGEHLSRYAAVDIVLDPFPFTGSTTTFEALWMGVPVVTLAGEAMVGRWSAAMLEALKLGDLIARTPADYIAVARALAARPERLSQLRLTLRDRIAASPLCDGERRTRQFERLLRALWRRRCTARQC